MPARKKSAPKESAKKDYYQPTRLVHRVAPALLVSLAAYLSLCLYLPLVGAGAPGGIVGAFLVSVLGGLYSYGAYLLPPLLLLQAVSRRRDVYLRRARSRTVFCHLFLLLGMTFCDLLFYRETPFSLSSVFREGQAYHGAGLLGTLISRPMYALCGPVGVPLLFLLLILLYLYYFCGVGIPSLIRRAVTRRARAEAMAEKNISDLPASTTPSDQNKGKRISMFGKKKKNKPTPSSSAPGDGYFEEGEESFDDIRRRLSDEAAHLPPTRPAPSDPSHGKGAQSTPPAAAPRTTRAKTPASPLQGATPIAPPRTTGELRADDVFRSFDTLAEDAVISPDLPPLRRQGMANDARAQDDIAVVTPEYIARRQREERYEAVRREALARRQTLSSTDGQSALSVHISHPTATGDGEVSVRVTPAQETAQNESPSSQVSSSQVSPSQVSSSPSPSDITPPVSPSGTPAYQTPVGAPAGASVGQAAPSSGVQTTGPAGTPSYGLSTPAQGQNAPAGAPVWQNAFDAAGRTAYYAPSYPPTYGVPAYPYPPTPGTVPPYAPYPGYMPYPAGYGTPIPTAQMPVQTPTQEIPTAAPADSHTEEEIFIPVPQTTPAMSPSSSAPAGQSAAVTNTSPASSASVSVSTPASPESTGPIMATDHVPDMPGSSSAPSVVTETPPQAPARKAAPSYDHYVYPPLSLLKRSVPIETGSMQSEIDEMSERLSAEFRKFKLEITVSKVYVGPRVTRYCIIPPDGVRINQITNLANDIALGLAVKSILINPVPPYLGVEVPNRNPSTVYLSSLFDTDGFRSAESKTTVCLGASVTGQPVFADLKKMPHVLIAGATGMGKSVCMNALLLSLLYRAKPNEVKLILVDPKRVELSMYNGIPHLLIPVVTEPQKAAGALVWAVGEMERRYHLMEGAGVRNIEGYNKAVAQGKAEGERQPVIVIVIDELNDLMMNARDAVEPAIMSIAQKARAAGIHLIIGTQRPSVDVITGVIKANIPSRIAFHVSSGTDSRTILDAYGAEKLLNNGDMLAYIAGKDPVRVQGAFVTDDEVIAVTDFLKKNAGPAVYDEIVSSQIESETEKYCNSKRRASDRDDMDGDEDADVGIFDDPRFIQAVRIALDNGKISTSLLQRKAGLGYGKAAKYIDAMEDLGIISPPDGQKPRDVLIDRMKFEEMLTTAHD